MVASIALPTSVPAQTPTGRTGAAAQPGVTSPMTAPSAAAEYMAMAASGDLYEKTSSQMVMDNAAAGAEVKRFAQHMVRDHAETTRKLAAAAQKAGLQAPAAPAMTQQEQAMVEQLRATQGAQMERVYLQQQMAAHEQALALHTGYAQRGDTKALREVAQEASKVVQAHITELRKIRSAAR